VEIYRNDGFLTNTTNDGADTDSPRTRGHAAYTYRVCEAGTQTCSNEATVTFRRFATPNNSLPAISTL